MNNKRILAIILFTLIFFTNKNLFSEPLLSPHIDIAGNVYIDYLDGSKEPFGDVIVELKNTSSTQVKTDNSNGYFRIRANWSDVFEKPVTIIFRIGEEVIASRTVTIYKNKSLRERDGSLLYKMKDTHIVEPENLDILIKDNIRNYVNEQTDIIGAEATISLSSLLIYIFTQLFIPPGAEIPNYTITREETLSLPIEQEIYEYPKLGKLQHNIGSLYFIPYGFRYSPSRNLSESVMTNPSPIPFEQQFEISSSGFISLNNDWYDNLVGYLGLYITISNDWRASIGYSIQDENFLHEFIYDTTILENADANNIEQILLLAISNQILPYLSIGLSFKYNHQTLSNIPSSIKRTEFYGFYNNDPTNEILIKTSDSIIKTTKNRQKISIDLSSTWDPFSNIRIGYSTINLINVSLTESYSIPSDIGVGIGMTIFLAQFQTALDLEYTQQEGLDFGLGLNFKPDSYQEYSIGFNSEKISFQLGAKYRAIKLNFQYCEDGFSCILAGTIKHIFSP